ncbi:kinetochore-associated Ndc80 complex subunit spc25 [Coemansia sp. Benny D115]|nr:kinetochore-associated Ndc80 complex subunit spc25 [Coemansia sp. Benny D115]
MSAPSFQGFSTPRRRPVTPGRRDHVLPSFNSPASIKMGRLLESAYSGISSGAMSLEEELPEHIADTLANTAVASTSEEYEAPRVWFKKDEDRRQNSEFTRRVDEMVQELKRLIRERTNDFEHQIEEGKEREKRMVANMEALETENKEILSALKSEHGEEDELSKGISGLQVKQREVKESVAQLSAQVAKLEAELEKKRNIIAEKQSVLESQAKLNQPELEFFEKKMGLSIVDGGALDSLTFVFTLISLSDPLRPFSITLDMSQHEYRVTNCQPAIMDMQDHVDWLNDSRDFFGFLKRIRKEFVEQYYDTN